MVNLRCQVVIRVALGSSENSRVPRDGLLCFQQLVGIYNNGKILLDPSILRRRWAVIFR